MQMSPKVFPALLVLIALYLLPAISPPPALAQEDTEKIPSCPFCGMDRNKFAHSRVYMTYQDGSAFGSCSIHCAAIEFSLNIDKTPLSIQVGDFNNKKLIDAQTAFWVLNGDLPGVMTRRAKWAFESKPAAQEFIHQHGGEHANFEQILKATYEDMYADTLMIREKRKQRRSVKPGGN